ncbi:toxin-antitoxin system HicB family antitoxin [Ornithinimicrobium sp. Y1847]|uniref:toxin-antitoxin system HicB family antitoxin n=1 Tax=unclassified Ornithinimicrobium TaxID=2615080 RepID=UPI003B66D036
MHLDPYLTSVADDLQRATALADDHTREISSRVATALEPALRLALLQALSDATAEITAQLAEATVTVRMAGRDPVLDVHHSPESLGHHADAGALSGTDTSPNGAPETEDDDTARVTVRLPASLKLQAETHAARADQSLNTWIVQAVRAALTPSTPPLPPPPPPGLGGRSRRITGWA